MTSVGSGLALTIVAAALGLGLAWFIASRRPRVILTERALLVRALRVGKIPWDEIEGAYLPRRDDLTSVVHLRVRLTPRLRRRLQRSRMAGQIVAETQQTVEFIVDLTDTAVSPVELIQAIVRGNASRPSSTQQEAAS